MASGVIDSKKNFHKLKFYEIEGLCKQLVKTATEDSRLKEDFIVNYQRKITRLSPEVLYAIDRLGWMIVDPLNRDLDVALVSDGKCMHFVSLDKINNEDFNREDLENEEAICPLLTDEALRYKDSLATTLGVESGIADEQGFVDAKVLGSVENLGEMLLMFELMHNKELYEKFLSERSLFESGFEYLISLPNVIAIRKNQDKGFNVQFVSENGGEVEKFVDVIDNESDENSLMVQEDKGKKK